MSTSAPPIREALHNLCLADTVWSERYEGWTELGRGGSAHVVRTFSRATGEDVALKIFHHLTADDARRFQQEVRSAQRLTSPYIVRTYSAFPRGSLAWMEMELVEGPDLGRELERRAAAGEAMPMGESLAIAEGLASALTTAHAAGVIHRDVKPGNVLLPVGGRPMVKLGDFGISRILGATRVTATGLLTGTPQFAAPEVADGETSRPESDIYSLALTLFLVFSGNRFPFPLAEDASAPQWLRAHREEPAWPLRRLCASAPAALEQLLADGLSKDPNRRPTAAEFLERLRAFHEGRSVVSRRDSPSRLMHWVLALVATSAVAGIALLRMQPAHAPMAQPSPTASVGEAALAPALAPAVKVTLQADTLVLLNASGRATDNLYVTLRGTGAGPFRAAAPGTLAPGEELILALDTFRPVPPSGWRPQQVEIAWPDGATETIDLLEPAAATLPKSP
jgi:serine/threonine protein kinase